MGKWVIGSLIDTMANIEYGILIAIVVVAVLLSVIASLNSKKKLTVLSYIIAAALLIPLAYQMSRLIGACQVSDTAAAINDIVEVVSPTLSEYVSSVANQHLGWFIFRRVIWSTLFIALATFGIVMTMDSSMKNQGRISMRRDNYRERRLDEHRPSRRKRKY